MLMWAPSKAAFFAMFNILIPSSVRLVFTQSEAWPSPTLKPGLHPL